MADIWRSLDLKLDGGMITNIPQVRLGVEAPGAARELQNFEPSLSGGYRRIDGFSAWDTNEVPIYGDPKVSGSGQTGTTLVIGNCMKFPKAGDTLTIDGVTGTYTVAADVSDPTLFGGINYKLPVTLTTSLASSPADQADVTFTSLADPENDKIQGLFFNTIEQFVQTSSTKVYAVRGGCLWSSSGSGWTKINKPSYGTLLVDGAGQTGNSLNIDGITTDTYLPTPGDSFTVDGIEGVYTVESCTSTGSGTATIDLAPDETGGNDSLASSPADNAAITILNNSLLGMEKVRFQKFNFDGTPKIVFCGIFDEVTLEAAAAPKFPCVITPSTSSDTFKIIQESDLEGAYDVAEFADHLFFLTTDFQSSPTYNVVSSAPFDEEDYTSGNGAVVIRLDTPSVGLHVFREQLFVFTREKIERITGTSSLDFAKVSFTEDLGCVDRDTIQEIGGDVIFLCASGLALLGSTDRIGDFSLGLASDKIKDEISALSSGSYCSYVSVEDNQYRIFEYDADLDYEDSIGYLGTQFEAQNAASFQWGSLKGVKAYRAFSVVARSTEYSFFTSDTGYVYRWKTNNQFDYETETNYIQAKFSTPYISLDDLRLRKTIYAITTYYNPEANLEGTLNVLLDLNQTNKVQPEAIQFVGTEPDGAYAKLRLTPTGSFFTISLEYTFNSTGGFGSGFGSGFERFEGASTVEPFVLDTIVLEYMLNDRK